MLRFVLLCVALCFSMAAAAQVAVISGQAIDQYGQPLPFASVRVCNAATSTGTPCTPTVPIYRDIALTVPASNPYTADNFGNYTLYVAGLAAPNLYVVQLSPASGITWSYVHDGPYCSITGCTFTGPITATLFNATTSPYFEINGTQITSGALSDHANIAYLNAANTFSVSPQTAAIFNATTQFNVAGSKIASANLADSANLPKLNAANTFTAANVFAALTGTTINATAGFQVAGVPLAAGNLSNGTSGSGAVCLATGSACAVSLPTIYYQTVAANGTAQTQRATLNFSTRLALTDSASPARTTVDLAATAVTPGSYVNPNFTVDTYGRITAASNGPTVNTLASVSFTSCALVVDGGTGTWQCQATQAWGSTLPSSSYKLNCQLSFGGNLSVDTVVIYTVSKTTTGFTYQVLADHSGANGASFTVDCVATT